MESIPCNTGCYQGPHLKKRRILLTCIDLYKKQSVLGIDFNPSPRRTCLLESSDFVLAYHNHEAADEQREIEQQGVHCGNLQLGEGCRHCTEQCTEHQLYA